MANQKHLVLSDRIKIEQALKESLSFKTIGKELNKDCTTISKEIRFHISFKKVGAFGHPFNNCFHRRSCELKHICDVCTSHNNRFCRFCSNCSSVLPVLRK